MIEMSMDEWGNRLLSTGIYKTIRYSYVGKYSIVRDTKTGNTFKAKYNMTTHMMNLTKVK